MRRVNRRKFMMMASVGMTGAALSACGNELDVEVNPTQIANVPGAPPTLAPMASPAADGGQQPAGGEQPAGGAGAPITLEAQDPYNWSTNTLEAAPGQVIQITNVGLGQHDFVVDEWGVDADLPNGEPVEVTVPEDAAPGDTFVYYCSVPGHRENGMEGELTVIEAAAAAAPQEEQPAAEQQQESGASTGSAGEPIALEAQDPYAWSANTLEAAPGQVIQITNTGLGQHDFTVDEWSLKEPLPNGQPVEVTVPEDVKPGDKFVFYCSVAGHRENGMEGELTIIEAAAPAAAPSGDTQATPPPAGDAGATPPSTGDAATPPPAETPPSSPAAVTSQAPKASPAAQATPRAGTVVLEAQDPYVWNPTSLTVKAGDVISVTNTGVLEHSFAVDEWVLDRLIPNGGLIEVQVPEDVSSGDTFTFYCSTAGHREQGMEGTITVQ